MRGKYGESSKGLAVAEDRAHDVDVEHPGVSTMTEKDVQKEQLKDRIDQIHHTTDQIDSEEIIATVFVPTVVDLQSHRGRGRGSGFQRLTVVLEHRRRCRCPRL